MSAIADDVVGGVSYTGVHNARSLQRVNISLAHHKGYSAIHRRGPRHWWPPKKRRLSDARPPHSVSTCCTCVSTRKKSEAWLESLIQEQQVSAVSTRLCLPDALEFNNWALISAAGPSTLPDHDRVKQAEMV